MNIMVDDNVLTYSSNTFKIIEDNDKKIRIQFGTRDVKENIIKVNASVQISPKMLTPLIERLIITTILYQEKYNLDLGLKGKIKIEGKEDE